MAEIKKLDSILKEVEKEFGKEIRIDTTSFKNIPRYKSRSPRLGYICGGGGYPKGRIIEIIGPESNGKTSLALIIAADIQRTGKAIVFLDMEHSLSLDIANIYGVDTTNNFYWYQPDNGEQCGELTKKFLGLPEIGCIITDSVASMIPLSEMEGEVSDSNMGKQALLMGKIMRYVVPNVGKTDTTMIYLQQIKMKIGVMFGSPETSGAGGSALRYAASIRLDVRKVEYITEKGSEEPIGLKVRVKAVKNKTCPPMRKGEIDIYYDRGIDSFNEYLDFGVSLGIIKRTSSWFEFGEHKVLGLEKLKPILKENANLYDDLVKKVDFELSNKVSRTRVKEEKAEITDNEKVEVENDEAGEE